MIRYLLSTLKIYTFLCITVITAVLINGCQSKSTDDRWSEISKAMSAIKAEHVPDRRVQIFDYTVSPDGLRISGRSSNRDAYEGVLMISEQFPNLNLDSFSFIVPFDSALINVSVGNMRSNPKHSSELSTQVLMGMEVKIWDQDGSWYYIQSPDNYLGWIDAGALTFPEQQTWAEYQSATKVMYRDDFGFCYEEPNQKSPVISDLVAGDILRDLGTSASFTKIMLPDGRQGYVPQTALRSLNAIAAENIPQWSQIEKTALQFTGRPYLWGGTSGKGVDCSGFTKMVYFLNGLELPRDASQQVHAGIEIPIDGNLSQLEPGDFLFFGTRGEDGKKDRITHVGIYLQDGRMIHSSERVQIQSLIPGAPDYVPERRNTLLTAKRMISGDSLGPGIRFIKDRTEYGF